MKVQISDDWIKGMGTQLGALSVFVNAGATTIEVGHMSIFNAFKEYRDIFKLENLQIEFTSDKILNSVYPGDAFKLFSPYYKKKRDTKQRPYIGIACYDDTGRVFNSSDIELTYPKNKFYPVENYTEIFKIIKNAGYDVVTFDNKAISLTDKSYIIENLCECVIGYEGGIAHLCHMLDVPYIMLPWRNNIGFEHLMHLDRKTYFLNTVHEFLNWTGNCRDVLLNTIDNLNNDLGNNKFLNGTSKLVISGDFNLSENGIKIPVEFNYSEKQFFRKYIKDFKVGGNE